MSTVRAIDFDDKEITIENVQEISQDMGDVTSLWDICGDHPVFGLRQCPNCRGMENKVCGKWFIIDSTRSEPELLEVDGKPVKEIIEIV